MTELLSRFWSHVTRTPTCWVWHAAQRGGKGPGKRYGAFKVDGKAVLAHKFSYEAYVGPIPDGLDVRHGCDNRLCVRPDHLSVGTRKENMQDAINRGRIASGERSGTRLHPETIARGENAGASKLTTQDVLKIKAMYAAGARIRDLASEFDVNRTTITRCISGKHWAHLGAF